jgi:hypothetical protein
MRNTPRTDKYNGTWASTNQNGLTIYEHAQQLERELGNKNEMLNKSLDLADSLADQYQEAIDDLGKNEAAKCTDGEIKKMLYSISIAGHLGDVADAIEPIADAIGAGQWDNMAGLNRRLVEKGMIPEWAK